MSITNLTSKQLRKAADIQDKIEALQADLAAILGSAPVAAAASSKADAPKAAKAAKGPKKRKGGMSAEGRARVAAAQKARWAKVKAAKAK